MSRFDMRIEFEGDSYHGIGKADDLDDLISEVTKCIAFQVEKTKNPKAAQAKASVDADQQYRDVIEVMEHSSGPLAHGQKVALAAKLGAKPPAAKRGPKPKAEKAEK